MPNAQVHAAIGMIGTILIIVTLYYILKIFNKEGMIKKLALLLPILIVIGAILSMVPDFPRIAGNHPTLFGWTEVDKHTDWNRPLFNIFFFHPLIDHFFEEKYDDFGFFLTLITLNGLSLYYFLRLRVRK